MESAIPRSLETTFGHRPVFSALDDGFDPLLEIRRLRQDLMLRLQRLQQSVVAEEKQQTDVPPPSYREEQNKLDPAVQASGSETVIYVAPIRRKLDGEPTYPQSQELTVITPSATDQSELETPIVGTSTDSDAVTKVETPEPLYIQLLAWVNVVLITIGVVGAAVGIYFHVLRKSSASPKQFAVTLLATGAAVVLIGVVGWWLHRQAKRRVSPDNICPSLSAVNR